MSKNKSAIMGKGIAEILQDQTFLHGLPNKYINILANCSEEITIKNGHFLLRFQQQAEQFYFLLQGETVLLNHVPGRASVAIESINAPDVVGWSWLMPPYRWHFDVKAVTELKSICIHTPALLKIMNNDRGFACEMYRRFMAVMLNRLQASRLQGMDVYAIPESKFL